MPGIPTHFTLYIDTESDVTEEERIELSRRLRKELLQLGELENVESPSAPMVPGSKAVAIDWQTLIVTLAASGGVFTTLIGAIQNWLSRQDKTSVTLEVGNDKLVISGASSDTQRRLVEDWVQRRKQ